MTFRIGPGALVAAAFIGPGTVTTCTLAGARFGYELVWALVFATAAAVVLQDMAARLGAHARKGLGEAMLETLARPLARLAAIGLILLALGVGNAAYQSGNLAGAALGVEAIAGESHRAVMTGVIAALAAGVLWTGRYRTLQRVLVGLVVAMALAFLAAAAIVRPDLAGMAQGLVPRVPDGGLLMTTALIGTTIVPYNLFLHAAAARRHFEAGADLAAVRADSALAIALGGIVSILIVATAAASLDGARVANAADMARALEPAFGPAARHLVGAGLFAAGLTSAITAPMATAYAFGELFPGKDAVSRRLRFRVVALGVVAIGAAIALSGVDAVSLIVTAQAANGLLLPVTAVILLVVVNRKRLMGAFANGLAANIAGGLVILVALGLGLRGVWRAIETAAGA